jgi:hypothetical protein
VASGKLLTGNEVSGLEIPFFLYSCCVSHAISITVFYMGENILDINRSKAGRVKIVGKI